jgi:hypothetical protein
MQTTPNNGPPDSPLAAAVAGDAPAHRRRHPARSAHARLLSALRGDKYMVNAYPPAWPNRPGAAEVRDPAARRSGK